MGHRVPLFFSAALSMHRRNESVLEGTLVRGVYALLSLSSPPPHLVALSRRVVCTVYTAILLCTTTQKPHLRDTATVGRGDAVMP